MGYKGNDQTFKCKGKMVKLTLLISKEAGGECLPTVSSLWGLLMKHQSLAFIRQGHGLSDLGVGNTTSKMTLEVP